MQIFFLAPKHSQRTTSSNHESFNFSLFLTKTYLPEKVHQNAKNNQKMVIKIVISWLYVFNLFVKSMTDDDPGTRLVSV